MKHIRTGLVLAAVLSLFFVSCSQDDAFVSLVPGNAYAVVRVNQAETFLGNVDAALAASPLAAQLGGMTVKSLLGIALSTSPAKMTLADVDLLKPMGAAILPPETAGSEVAFAVYLPSQKPEDLAKKLTAMADENTKVFSAKGYAVITVGIPSYAAAPANPLKLRGDLVYKDDEVLVYVPAKELLGTFQKEWQDMKTKLTDDSSLDASFSTLPAGMNTAGMVKLVKGIAELMVQTVESADTFVSYIKIDKVSLDIRGRLGFAPDSPVAKGLKDFPGGSIDAKDFNSLPDNHLMAMALSLKPAAYAGLVDTVLEAFVPILGLDEAQTKELKDLVKEGLSVMGEKTLATMDYKLDMAALQAMESGTEDASAVAKALDMKFLAAMDVSSADAYNAYMQKSFNSPVVKSLMEKAFSLIGVTGGIKLGEGEVGGQKYQKIGYELSIPQAAEAGEGIIDGEITDAAALTMMTDMLNSMSIAVLAKDKKVYMAMPDKDNGASLKDFVDGKLESAPLGSHAVFSEFLKKVPQGSQLVFRMNLDNLMGMIQQKPAEQNPKHMGLCGYLKIENQAIEGAYSMGITEIMDLVGLAMQGGLGAL